MEHWLLECWRLQRRPEWFQDASHCSASWGNWRDWQAGCGLQHWINVKLNLPFHPFFQLLKQLAADPSYNKVISVGRRKVVQLSAPWFISYLSFLAYSCFRLTCPPSLAWKKWFRRKLTLTTSLNTPLLFQGFMVSYSLNSRISSQSWFSFYLSGDNKGQGWCRRICEGGR